MPSGDEWLLPEVTAIKHMLDKHHDVGNTAVTSSNEPDLG